MKKTLLCASIIVLSGCASVGDIGAKFSGMGRFHQYRDSFDDSLVLTVSPAALYDEQSWLGVPVHIGAKWISNAPDYVALVLTYRSNSSGSNSNMYMNIKGLSINIDGKKSRYDAGLITDFGDSGYNKVTQTIYTKSRNSVVLPIRDFDKMLTANDVKIRIYTSKGYINAHFSVEQIPGGMHTARYFMKQFMQKVCKTGMLPQLPHSCTLKT